MGGAKQKWIEDQDRGYYLNPSLRICSKHFYDPDLVNWIETNGRNNGRKTECNFCENEFYDDEEEEEIETQNTIPWDELMGRIMPAIEKFFNHPANELGYMSSEGGYIGDHFDSIDLLQNELSLDADYEVIEEIASTLTDNEWTYRDFYGPSENQYHVHSWELFENLVKHKVRYIFHNIKAKSDYGNYSYKPYSILKDISRFILDLELIRDFPESSTLFNSSLKIFRARQHPLSKKVDRCKKIGPPSSSKASANRFSPEGISLFYGAEDEETAIKEVINKSQPDEYISVGIFEPVNTLKLIDLRDVPVIGYFNVEKLDYRESSIFLKEFVHRISKKTKKDGRERIDYVPSQIVTEYFRYVLLTEYGSSINGIIYKSIQNPDRDCYAIFADKTQCSDEESEDRETILRLTNNSIRKFKVAKLIKKYFNLENH